MHQRDHHPLWLSVFNEQDMTKDWSVPDARANRIDGAEALVRQVDQIMREIEQTKQERAAEAARLARARLAAVHTVKRRRNRHGGAF